MRRKLTRSEAGKLGAKFGVAAARAASTVRRAAYILEPKRCRGCNAEISYESRRNDFCSHSCAATFINCRRYRSKPRKDGYLKNCLSCGLPISWPKTRFCSKRCHKDAQYREYIDEWLRGLRSGITESQGRVASPVRRYLFSIRGERCENCGWCEINPATGRSPLTIDHVDGRWQNCRPENLRILCPNCHSLTPTFMALNRGNGHPWRRDTYRSRKLKPS